MHEMNPMAPRWTFNAMASSASQNAMMYIRNHLNASARRRNLDFEDAPLMDALRRYRLILLC